MGGHTISLPFLLIELFYIGMPVVRTDSRSVGRSVYDHVITHFLGWVIYHIFLPMLLRWVRLVRESSAVKDAQKCVSELQYLTSYFLPL